MDSYKKNTQEKDIKNPFSDTYMKNSESKLKKNEFSEEFIEEIMNILNIQDLENIKLMDPENLQNKRKDFIKDIPEAQKLIDSGIDVSELEKELVEKIEKKHPGFKIIYKSAIEEAKLKKKNKKSSEKK